MKYLLLGSMILLIFSACTIKLTTQKSIEFKKELQEMVEIDQVAANIPQGKYKEYSQAQWTKFQDSVFSTNEQKAKSMFDKYGFPGIDKVGKDGSKNFWLVVQHCDKYPAFQQEVLKAMDKEVKKENANSNDYAYLFDRVKVNAGEKQLFGTQVTYEVQTTGRAIPKIGLIDSINVDKIRKEYGLGPLKDYLNQMTTMHFEMNKERYEKRGITKPNLY